MSAFVFPKSAPAAEAVFYRTYSRMTENGRESYEQVVERNLAALVRLGKLTEEETDLLRKNQLALRSLPSGRWLWVGGTEWIENPDNFYGAYNCTSSEICDFDSFGLLMSLAMMGCGTGAVIEERNCEMLPTIDTEIDVEITLMPGECRLYQDASDIRYDVNEKVCWITVGDSREGWVSAYREIFNVATWGKGRAKLLVNLGNVRPPGEKLKGFGGVANPIKLPDLFTRVVEILNKAIGRKLNALECCLLIDEAASVVVAGNIRRCLPETALVHTAKGLIPIKDIQIGDYVQTPIGFRKVTNKFDQGIQEVVEVETNAVNPIATANHRMAVLKDAKGGYEWKQVKDLLPEDRLLHTNSILPGIQTQLPNDHTEDRPAQSRTCKSIEIPAISPEVAWLIGFTHGNGYVSLGRNKHGKPYGNVSWTTNATQPELAFGVSRKLRKALSLFGLTASENIVNGENTFKVICSSIRLAEYFFKYIKQPNAELKVPSFILQAEASIRSAYLAGLFDSDGSVGGRPPILVTTAYRNFAREVSALASSLGIACRLRNTYRKNHWKMLTHLTIPALKESFNALIAPYSVKGELAIGLRAHGFTVSAPMMRETYCHTEMRMMGFNGSYAIATNYESYMEKSQLDFDIPVTVKGIGSIDVVQTYDIEVEEAHCFYCDGYLTHNSAGMRQFSEDSSANLAKANLWTQDKEGNWVVDHEKDALRMANHTVIYHGLPTYDEILESVRQQYVSGEGAIQFAPEAIARANADLLNDEDKKSRFIRKYLADKGSARKYLYKLGEQKESEKILDHRMIRYGLNPCGEIQGSDFFCNLGEVHLNMLHDATKLEIDDAFRAAAISVAVLLNHQFNIPRYRFSRENDPIVGVSFTGLFDFFVHRFGVEWLEWWAAGRPNGVQADEFKEGEQKYLSRWRGVVQEEIKSYCEKHGLRVPSRTTTCQPAGTKSLLSGASPGWHPPKAQRFIRRITFGKNDPVAKACMMAGYSVIPSQSDKDENGKLLDDPFDSRCTEWLVEIPTEVSWANLDGADKIDLHKFSAKAQFDFYMQVQRYYVTHNCFARKTEFLTDKGVKTFEDFEAGDTVTVLNANGEWTEAKVVNTGNARDMYEIVLRQGSTGKVKAITATACHRFPVKRASNGSCNSTIKTTLQLKPGHRFVTNTAELPDLDLEAVKHGIVFGDGSLYKTKGIAKGAQVYLCGEKRSLSVFFDDNLDRTYEREEHDQTRIYGFPVDYKYLPAEDCSQDYLAGFLAGLFATDGNISQSTLSLSTSREDVVAFVCRQSPRLGISVSGVRSLETNRSSYKPGVIHYEIRFSKETFPENMVLRELHQMHLDSKESQPRQWRVQSVTKLEHKQIGWCVMEPETNQFTLSQNILVMNTSATIEYREEEIEELADCIYKSIGDGYISAALLARFDASETFPRLPFEPITKEVYNDLIVGISERKVLSFEEALRRYDEASVDVTLQGPAGCDSDKCMLPLAS